MNILNGACCLICYFRRVYVMEHLRLGKKHLWYYIVSENPNGLTSFFALTNHYEVNYKYSI